MTTLYDYLKMSESDHDTYDTVYDAVVTVCYIGDEDENDDYDKFCNNIVKKVSVVKVIDDALTVNWSELVERNMDKFRRFASEHWYESCQYKNNDDEFVYQWINEIHMYMAGYVSMDFYSVLSEFVNSLE